MKVGVVDYGMSNLGSVRRALAELGCDPFVAAAPAELGGADRIVLPGVGSFGDGMKNLAARGWVSAIRDEVAAGKPLLGICLGMQLLATTGTEGGERGGLDLIPGTIRRIDDFGCALRIPHVGWNSVVLPPCRCPLFEGIPGGTDFYFVHSFAFDASDRGDVVAEVQYGVPLAAAVARGHVFGAQFHPEKSSRAGFRLLKNFLEFEPC